MNRTTALLLAMGLLVAHALTIQQDPSGTLGTVADRAYVALRLGRNWVHSGGPVWNPGLPGTDVYPGWAWLVGIAVAERLYQPSLVLIQTAGLLGALGLVVAVSRFSANRTTGVIGPFLLVVSGTVAVGAFNGTEWSAFTLATVLAVLSAEEGRSRLLIGSVAAATALRPEGVLLLLALAALAPSHRDPGTRLPWGTYARATVAMLVVLGLRWLTVGAPLPPSMGALWAFDPERFDVGLRYVASFFLKAGMPFLILVPLAWYAQRPRRASRSIRALLLATAWAVWLAWSGGDALPFWAAMLPTVALLVIAIQDALTALVNDRRRPLRLIGWTLFTLGLGSSALASKQQADLGPLPLKSLQVAWHGELGTRAVDELDVGLTRLGQLEALVAADRLRCIGLFVRDTLPSDASVLTPWPGTIGYLSRKQVHDLGQRVEAAGDARPRPWFGPLRGDVERALEGRPDFIIPSLQLESAPSTSREVLADWLERFDTGPRSPERLARLEAAFEEYAPLAVPIPVDSQRPNVDAPEPFVILRHRSAGRPPRLSISVEGRDFGVDVRHAGHRLVASLVVEVVDADGTVHALRPTGAFDRQAGVRARPRLLIYPSGRRPVRLASGRLPNALDPTQIRARLALPRQLHSAAAAPTETPEWDAVVPLSDVR
ncbi:MAG: hypothetical protein AAFZ65_08005 [Planctomycetota bacterium]